MDTQHSRRPTASARGDVGRETDVWGHGRLPSGGADPGPSGGRRAQVSWIRNRALSGGQGPFRHNRTSVRRFPSFETHGGRSRSDRDRVRSRRAFWLETGSPGRARSREVPGPLSLSPRRRPSDEAVGLVGPEAILQPLDEAGVDLADARLREPCQVTDLAHGQLFPVLEIDDPTLLI